MKTYSSYLDSQYNEDFIIDEVGMKLNPDQKQKIKSRLQILASKAPSVSTIHLEFLKNKNSLKGILKIIGLNETFYSKLEGSDPWEIYQVIENEVNDQIFKWKKIRFNIKNAENSPIHYNQSVKRRFV